MASDFQVNPIDGTSTRASSWQRAFQPRNRRLVAEPGPGIKQDALPISRLQEPIEGPRFRFLCEEHLKLPKKKQDEVLAKWGREE